MPTETNETPAPTITEKDTGTPDVQLSIRRENGVATIQVTTSERWRRALAALARAVSPTRRTLEHRADGVPVHVYCYVPSGASSVGAMDLAFAVFVAPDDGSADVRSPQVAPGPLTLSRPLSEPLPRRELASMVARLRDCVADFADQYMRPLAYDLTLTAAASSGASLAER